MLGQLRLDRAAEKIPAVKRGQRQAGPARACAGFGCRGCSPPDRCRRLRRARSQQKEEAASIGGAFTLVDQDGHTVTDEAYRGKWLLIYFGYTHCPDTCPMALSNIAAALDQLDPAIRARLQPIFVTVDPERDTPAVMKDYVGAFAEPASSA